MGTRHRNLPRLNIPGSREVQQQQQHQLMGFENGRPLFSPALASAMQPGFLPQFPIGHPGALQTPIQPFFNPQTPGVPGRPPTLAHQPHPSIGHLNVIGLHPPNGVPLSVVPMTPLGPSQFPPRVMMGNGPGFNQHFPPRNRRSASISIGGPPKAVLGGPARKLSPLPQREVKPPTPAPVLQGKKVTVNLPKETVPGEEGQPATRPEWAREPLRVSSDAVEHDFPPPESSTAETYPPESWARQVPNTLDVFLPGKSAWDILKQKMIEEKLEKLGVERGSGCTVPHIFAPHARAASISSPADPALLLFKLNKLQQSQANSAANSMSSSPQPPHLTPPPGLLPPRFQNRHIQSMSLAPQPSFQPPMQYNPSAAFNPFGPNAVLGSDQIFDPTPADNIYAPQGRVPVTLSSLSAPDLSSRSRPSSRDSRPDFTRGFGLDIPEVDEVEEAPEEIPPETSAFVNAEVAGEGDESLVEDQGTTTVGQSRHHSRHVSRLSAALSLRSVGGRLSDPPLDDAQDMDIAFRGEIGNVGADEDAVEEWTGSEDLRVDSEFSEDESLGEWSNPSDEERAREGRRQRRMLRRSAHEIEVPRRLPNFPRPPSNDFAQAISRSDDMLTNPSEDDLTQPESYSQEDEYQMVEKSRPLPPIPHSRVASGHFSSHGSAFGHGSHASLASFVDQPQLAAPRRDSLNPHAKPFVFGTHQSGSRTQPLLSTPPQVEAEPPTHARAGSVGKPLNAAAVEFTPSVFNFRPPPGVPQLSFPIAEPPRPLPPVPIEPSPARNQQGREKRQRRSSSGTQDSQDHMASFRFPLPDSPHIAPLSASASPEPQQPSLNAAAPPFKASGLLDLGPHEQEQRNLHEPDGSHDYGRMGEDTVTENEMESPPIRLPKATFKAKRAPIPLDFTHPVSRNTVPAGLFKALVNNADERTRRSVRSRMSSRDVSEHMHRPSLDDLMVPAIARRTPRSNLIASPENDNIPELPDLLPSARHSLRSAFGSGPSTGISAPAMDLSRGIDMQEFEQRLESILDEKIEVIRRELLDKHSSQAISSSTEAIVAEVLSLFRAQMQDSAARGLDDSGMEVRGELDFELVKDTIRQGHAENQALLQRELNRIVDRLVPGRSSGHTSSQDIMPGADQPSRRMIDSLAESVSQLTAHVEQFEGAPSALDQNMLLRDLMDGLAPAIASLRPDPIDYDYLTARLTQAVKPHISQLIDLASDKRETAGLIVDRILPLLPLSHDPEETTNAIISQLTTEIRRAIAPIDAHEIKEQVADLVVERLDCRLAVRDRMFNVDTVAGTVTESVAQLLQPLQEIPRTVADLMQGQHMLTAGQELLTSAQSDFVSRLSDVPTTLVAVTSSLSTIQEQLRSQPGIPSVHSGSDEYLVHIKSLLEDVVAAQNALARQHDDLIPLNNDVLERHKVAPDNMIGAINALQAAQAEFALVHDAAKRELDELRKANADLQVQLARARGVHGQIRAEKEAASDGQRLAEAERERLRAQVDALRASASAQSAEYADIERKNRDLDEALKQALGRLQAADVAAQVSQERIEELERTNSAITSEKQATKSKADKFELQLTFAARDQESSTQALATLQKQYDRLASQQSHWDDLRQASQQIETIASLLGHADNEETKELKRIRDRSQVLEGEHTALQKRFKDQESKISNSERALLTVRQSLATANQRSSEWERRAKESEGKFELTHTQLDQLEQTHSQLQADHSEARMQLEEKEAEERLSKDRESRLREQVASLETRLSRLQSEVERLRGTSTSPFVSAYRKPASNGNNSHRLPSTAHTSPARTPGAGSTRSETPPAHGGVWASIHAPRDGSSGYATPTSALPKSRHSSRSHYHTPGPPSPTFSVVTRRDDGWYE